ncbi:MAG: class I SAM-dependent methyltransferase [Flavobacteriaceae bacterium]|nr:class I SAM-dependent methyltransferase [Flavobacteriaceae bacterium]
MFHKFKSYFTFLLKSTNEHGVHSPFVYNLVTQCFYADTNLALKSAFLKYKKELLWMDEKINITDFGAGSRCFKGNKRAISAIAKNAGISTKRAALLIRLVQYFKPKNLLELGTSLGLSTYCLHLGNPQTNIETLEGCLEIARIAINQLHKFGVKPTLNVGNFEETLPISLKNKTFDFIYIDGNHQKEATISYFEQCLKSVHNDSIIIFDDIHWSEEMGKAWEIIQKNPLVTVSIDTFQWGIIFFRKEQEKEHFIIRV